MKKKHATTAQQQQQQQQQQRRRSSRVPPNDVWSLGGGPNGVWGIYVRGGAAVVIKIARDVTMRLGRYLCNTVVRTIW